MYTHLGGRFYVPIKGLGEIPFNCDFKYDCQRMLKCLQSKIYKLHFWFCLIRFSFIIHSLLFVSKITYLTY